MFFSLATPLIIYFPLFRLHSLDQLALQSITPGVHLLCHLSAQPPWNMAISLVLLASFHRDRKLWRPVFLCNCQTNAGRNKAGGQWVLEGQKGWKGFSSWYQSVTVPSEASEIQSCRLDPVFTMAIVRAILLNSWSRNSCVPKRLALVLCWLPDP